MYQPINPHNLQQQRARLEREIAHFRAQVESFTKPASTRDKAALTLSSRKLAAREKQLQELKCPTN
jgi:prefoldin subunit 5